MFLLVTEVKAVGEFGEAEEERQDYL